MTIDVDQRGTVVATFHFVHFPELIVERLAGHQLYLISVFLCLGEKALWLMG